MLPVVLAAPLLAALVLVAAAAPIGGLLLDCRRAAWR
jgi:hypothetical protein